MAEDENEIKLNSDTRKVKVLLDTSPQVAAREEKIAELNQKIGEQESLIKSMLVRDRAEFIERIEPRKPPEGGDTLRLDQEERANRQVTTFNLAEDSYIPVEFVRGKNAAEVIEKAESIANSKAENRDEYKKILSRLTKKMLNSNKELNIEFRGSSKEFIKAPLPISEFDSDEVRARKVAYNERLRNNRCSWQNLNED